MEKCITTCTIFYVILITHMFVYGYTLINSSDLKKLDSLLSDEQRAIYDKKKGKITSFLYGIGRRCIIRVIHNFI